MAFDPLSISGCITWLDMADASTLYDATTGGSLVAADAAIARIDDKSGTGRHVTQSTGSYRPIRKLAQQNGLATAKFDGVDDAMSGVLNLGRSGNPAFSVFWVCKKLVAGGGCVLGWGDVFVALASSGIYDDGSTIAWAYAGSNQYYISAIGTASFHQFSSLKSAGQISTTSTVRKDGVSVATSGHSTNTPNITDSPFVIGRLANYLANKLNGHIGEVLVYDTKLSDADRDSVESYLNTKWFVEPSLGSSRRRRSQSGSQAL